MGVVAFLYGAVGYLAFLVSFTYAIGFVGNALVSKGIDSAPRGSLPEAVFWLGWMIALSSTFLINYFALFGLRQGYLRLKGAAGGERRGEAGVAVDAECLHLVLGLNSQRTEQDS